MSAAKNIVDAINKMVKNSKYEQILIERKSTKKNSKKNKHDIELEKIINDFSILKTESKKFKNLNKNKKLTYEDLRHISDKYHTNLIRNPSDWVSKSYNKRKQIISFYQHCFCKYKTPKYLLSYIDEKHRYLFDLLNNREGSVFIANLFFAFGSGKSIIKKYKEYFTKKEANIFYNINNAPNFRYAFWKAKFDARKIKESLFKKFYMKVHHLTLELNDAPTLIIERKCHILDFIALYQDDFERNYNEFDDILDFCIDIQNRTVGNYFSGRTFNSVVNLSNEWHRNLINKKYATDGVFWEKCKIKDFEYIDNEDNIWTITQLSTAKELFSEGNAMKHCVGSYVTRCVNGHSYIFSVKCNLERIVTVEINKNYNGFKIVQMKGKANSIPSHRAQKVINIWKNSWKTYI